MQHHAGRRPSSHPPRRHIHLTITEGPDEDGKMLIQPVDEAPGAYPFPMKPEDLIAAS
ncbi:hypothetical protein GS454_23710 [Rhodococcus hoagii]|nr:hypothetical protein [Prescottella equi]